jgi:hypothetical protein
MNGLIFCLIIWPLVTFEENILSKIPFRLFRSRDRILSGAGVYIGLNKRTDISELFIDKYEI